MIALVFRDQADVFFNGDAEAAAGTFASLGLRKWLTQSFDRVFMIAANIFVLFCLVLLIAPLGKIRPGGADAKPN